jgi:hypothetical protein
MKGSMREVIVFAKKFLLEKVGGAGLRARQVTE